MLIHNKDDNEFVTEFPCFFGHPVEKLTNFIIRYVDSQKTMEHEDDIIAILSVFIFVTKQVVFLDTYSETLNNECMERIHQMSYSLLSDNGMLQIFSFLIK